MKIMTYNNKSYKPLYDKDVLRKGDEVKHRIFGWITIGASAYGTMVFQHKSSTYGDFRRPVTRLRQG